MTKVIHCIIMIRVSDKYNIYIYIYMWGQRIWQSQPISYQVQGPRRGGRNARGSTKKVQAARRRCRGQSCSWRTKVTEGESGTPIKIASPGVPSKKHKRSGPTIGAWWRSNSREGYHLCIKCPQLTTWPH